MKVVCLLAITSLIAVVSAGNYNYGDVISKSLLFYEAQRSGALPSTNRISWRRTSFTQDKDGSIDLSKGYFDAGDYVKFNFPAAWSITTLAWGGIDFASGYSSAGELDNLKWAVKWGTDYFIKSHPSDNVLYAQVGNGDADHGSWDLPERWTATRPVYKLTTSAPGSDLAGEVAAAFAASSMLFKSSNSAYSATLLAHARTTYNFAKTYKGKYSDSVSAASPFYTSHGYDDELAWAAAWLYRATGESGYLSDAKSFYSSANLQWNSGFSWDNKASGVDALLTRLTGESTYKNALEAYCNNAVYTQQKTAKGLVFFTQWGSLRAASNAVYICLQAAQLNIQKTAFKAFGKTQIDYMLGDSGRSYVVGFGNNPPKNAHHRSSSCPNPPTACGWSFFNDASKPNTNQVVGALVGGPGENDDYIDKRDDAVHNEVAMDYNAGFQGALAGLLSI